MRAFLKGQLITVLKAKFIYIILFLSLHSICFIYVNLNSPVIFKTAVCHDLGKMLTLYCVASNTYQTGHLVNFVDLIDRLPVIVGLKMKINYPKILRFCFH